MPARLHGEDEMLMHNQSLFRQPRLAHAVLALLALAVWARQAVAKVLIVERYLPLAMKTGRHAHRPYITFNVIKLRGFGSTNWYPKGHYNNLCCFGSHFKEK